MFYIHFFCNLLLKSAVNTPLYEIMAADIIEFPAIYLTSEHKRYIYNVHLSFSSERPDVNFLARSNLISHCFMSKVNFYLLAMHSLYLF